MILDQVAKELRSALEQLRAEHARLTNQITSVENLLGQIGAPVRRGPGRPKGSGKKRGPGRPKGSGKKPAAQAGAGTAAKRGPGRPKKKAPAAAQKSGSAKVRRKPHWTPEAKAAAAERMRQYWASRKKSSGA